MQSRLIHQPNIPSRELISTPAEAGLRWRNVELTTEDDLSLHGWYVPASQQPHLTLLFFHGNAGNISLRLESLEIFHELGLATLIIDYRGYGRSEGKPSEDGIYRDARAAWRHLVESRGVAPKSIIAFGRSMGGAVAANLAVERELGGLIVESAFTSVPDRAAELYPIFPARLMSRIDYPTKTLVEQVEVPVLVVHSPDDEVIPFHHGEAIYQAASQPKAFLRLSGGHNSGFLESEDRYKAGLAEWLGKRVAATR